MATGFMYNPKPEKSAKAYGRALRLSHKSSTLVCRSISGLSLKKGMRLLENLLIKKVSLSGKYYTGAVEEILELIKSAQANAEFKGLDLDRLLIHASSHPGFSFYRPRKFKNRRTQRKIAHIQIVLEEK